MTGIIKTDQLKGAQSSTITIPTGNKICLLYTSDAADEP